MMHLRASAQPHHDDDKARPRQTDPSLLLDSGIMEECVEFDINDALKHYTIDPQSVATPEAPSELVDAVHDPESLTPALVNSVLNSVIDDVAESPDAITRSSVFDTLQFLLKYANVLPAIELSTDHDSNDLYSDDRQSEKTPLASLSKVFDLVTSAISTETDLANGDIDADNEEALPRHKQLLQMYAFLLQWAVSAIETRVIEQRGTTTATGRGKGAKAKKDAKDTSWDPSKQLEKSLDVMSKVLSLRLVRIFVATSERDTFVGMFTKAVYHILENEARVKTASIKRSCFKVLCIAVRNHGQAFSMIGIEQMHESKANTAHRRPDGDQSEPLLFRASVRTHGGVLTHSRSGIRISTADRRSPQGAQ